MIRENVKSIYTAFRYIGTFFGGFTDRQRRQMPRVQNLEKAQKFFL